MYCPVMWCTLLSCYVSILPISCTIQSSYSVASSTQHRRVSCAGLTNSSTAGMCSTLPSQNHHTTELMRCTQVQHVTGRRVWPTLASRRRIARSAEHCIMPTGATLWTNTRGATSVPCSLDILPSVGSKFVRAVARETTAQQWKQRITHQQWRDIKHDYAPLTSGESLLISAFSSGASLTRSV